MAHLHISRPAVEVQVHVLDLAVLGKLVRYVLLGRLLMDVGHEHDPSLYGCPCEFYMSVMAVTGSSRRRGDVRTTGCARVVRRLDTVKRLKSESMSILEGGINNSALPPATGRPQSLGGIRRTRGSTAQLPIVSADSGSTNTSLPASALRARC